MKNDTADRVARPGEAISDETVRDLLGSAGLNVSEERLGAVADRLREMHRLAEALDDVNVDDAEPEQRFDAGWRESEPDR